MTDAAHALAAHAAGLRFEAIPASAIARAKVFILDTLGVGIAGSSLPEAAALLPIGSAIAYAGFALITRRVGSQESPWTSMLLSSAFGTLAGGALTLPAWQPVAAADLPLFLAIGLLGTGAQLCIVRSFSLAEASVVAPFSYVGIVCAAVWGIVLFGAFPDGWTVLGALVIAGAGIYVWHRETRAASRVA
jgi:drug/metabolite transporter (DMT)-like permease